VRRRRVLFLHLSRLRRTIKKSAIAVLFVLVFVFMLLNKTNNALIEKTSTTAEEIVTPITEILVMPASMLLNGYDYLRSLRKIDLENQALREENHKLIIANAKNRAAKSRFYNGKSCSAGRNGFCAFVDRVYRRQQPC